MNNIKINTFREEVLKEDKKFLYEPTSSEESIFAKFKNFEDLHTTLTLSAKTSLGMFAASSLFSLNKNFSFMKYAAGASLIASLISLAGFFLISKKENKNIFKEIVNCIRKYDKNSYYNSINPESVEKFAKYNNNINAYVKLAKTNCSQEAIKELRENNLLTDNIKSWIEGYKQTSNISFIEYLKNNNFNKDYLNKILKAKCYGSSANAANFFKNYNEIERKKILEQFKHDSDATNDLQDNKIGSFRQGQMGDCWLLSTLLTLSEEEVKNIIINNNQDGSFTVKFKGIDKYIQKYNENNQKNKKFKNGIIVTEAELKENKNLSKGDKDVRILEIAFNKLRKQIQNKNLNGGNANEAFLLLTQKELNYKKFNGIKETKQILDNLSTTKKYVVSSKNKIENKLFNNEIIESHSVIIESINKKNETVTVINPWNTYERKILTYYEIEKYFDGFFYKKEETI